MKKFFAILLTLLLVMGLAACGDSADEEVSTLPATNETPAETPAVEPEEENAGAEGGTLVVYFSMTGTTRGVAEKIATITGADMYEIKAAQEYTSNDLNYNDSETRATVEQKDPTARPASFLLFLSCRNSLTIATTSSISVKPSLSVSPEKAFCIFSNAILAGFIKTY